MLLSGERAPLRLLQLALWLVVASATSRAHGLEVALETQGCVDLPDARVRELAALELTTRVVAPRAPRTPEAQVLVSCEGPRVSIRVTDSVTGKVVMRSFALEQTDPDVRARSVALAVAELVLTSWLELMLPQPAGRAGASIPASEDRRAASAIVRERTRRGPYVDGVLAFAEVGGTFRATPSTGGAGVRLSLVLDEPLFSADADLSATLASERAPLGDVHVTTWSLALRPALRLQRGPWLGTFGVGARGGLARIEGEPDDPSASRGRSLVGTWCGPLVHANAGLSFLHFTTRLGGEAGYALRGVSGSVGGSDRAGVRGAWLLLSLGFGWGA